MPAGMSYAAPVTSASIADGTVVNVDVSASAAIARAKLADRVVNTLTGDYTLVLADVDACVVANKASAIAFTVPPNASVAAPVGSTIDIANIGAGTLTLTPGAAVALDSPNGLTVPQYASAELTKVATNTWIVELAQSGATVPQTAIGIVAAPTGVAATDSAAIQAALDAAATVGSGLVLLQRGIYVLGTTSIQFPVLGGNGLVLRGQGKGTTVVTYNGASFAFIMGDGGGTDAEYQYLDDMTVQGLSATPLGTLKRNNTRFCAARRCELKDCTNAAGLGIYALASVANYFSADQGNRITNMGAACIKYDGAGGVGGNSNHPHDNWFGNTPIAILCNAVSSTMIERNEFNGGITTAVSLTGASDGTTLVGNKSDGPTTAVNIGSSCTDTVIVGKGMEPVIDNGTGTVYLTGAAGLLKLPTTQRHLTGEWQSVTGCVMNGTRTFQSNGQGWFLPVIVARKLTVIGLGVELTTAAAGRTVADGVLNSTTTITSATAAFVAGDIGAHVTGTGIPAATWIASVTNGTTAVLSQAATASASGVSITLNPCVRLGICADDGLGQPGDRILDAGTVDVHTGTGDRTILSLSQVLTPTLYWLAVVGQGGLSALRATNGGAGTGVIGSTSVAGFAQGNSQGRKTTASAIPGALPTNVNSILSPSGAGTCPVVAYLI